MVEFKPITEENFLDIINMKRPEEERFAASNDRAAHLYEKLGFLPTGEVSHGEAVMELKLQNQGDVSNDPF